jgi:predicted O-methyltransferase YrrM
MLLQERPLPVGGITVWTWMTEREGGRLAHHAPGKNVLEIGSAYGYSAITMALAGASHVWAVDPHFERPDTLAGMRQNLIASGCQDTVTMVLGRSSTFFDQLATTDLRFDLIFVDGDHSYDGCTLDVLGTLESLAIGGGMLMAHDYRTDGIPGPRQALDELFPEGPDLVTDTLWEKAVS